MGCNSVSSFSYCPLPCEKSLFPFVHGRCFVSVLYVPSTSHNWFNYNPWFMTHSFRVHFYLCAFNNNHPMQPHAGNLAVLVWRAPIFHVKSKIPRLVFQLLVLQPGQVTPLGHSEPAQFVSLPSFCNGQGGHLGLSGADAVLAGCGGMRSSSDLSGTAEACARAP